MFRWSELPKLPDREGFAGSFAGVSNGALIVAGGANFPGKRPWEGGTKVWYDKVFVLPSPKSVWLASTPLKSPLGYGVSASTPDGLICAGGSDATGHHRDVFLLRWTGQSLDQMPLPSLPCACANMSGAVVDDTLYIGGGIESPASTECLATFWSLNLVSPNSGWKELDPCPGKPRMLAVAGELDGEFYLFSGTSLSLGSDGKPHREYLKDGWRYSPKSPAGQRWKQLADLPRAAVAAPSPAPAWDGRHLLVVSGDDGQLVGFKPETDHPGFPRSVLAYDADTDSWSNFGPCPLSRATAPTVEWNGTPVIASGEARPGYRTPEVWTLESRVKADAASSRTEAR